MDYRTIGTTTVKKLINMEEDHSDFYYCYCDDSTAILTGKDPMISGNEFEYTPMGPGLDLAHSQNMKLEPTFLNGRSVRKTLEQSDVKKNEAVQIRIHSRPCSGHYGLVLVHSHVGYMRYTIRCTKNDPSENQVSGGYPLRAWTDNETHYRHVNVPTIGEAKAAIVYLDRSNVVNLSFPLLSSDPSNHGNKKDGRLWDLMVFPLGPFRKGLKEEAATLDVDQRSWDLAGSLPVQVTAGLRDSTKLKRPKRLTSALASMPGNNNLGAQRDREECLELFRQYLSTLNSQSVQQEKQRLRASLGIH